MVGIHLLPFDENWISLRMELQLPRNSLVTHTYNISSLGLSEFTYRYLFYNIWRRQEVLSTWDSIGFQNFPLDASIGTPLQRVRPTIYLQDVTFSVDFYSLKRRKKIGTTEGKTLCKFLYRRPNLTPAPSALLTGFSIFFHLFYCFFFLLFETYV